MRDVPLVSGEAQAYAKAEMLRRGRTFVTAVGTTSGSPDMVVGSRVTLQSVECLCACEAAPMMQVDDRYELNLTPEKVDRILGELR